jgi:hypothetical protein
MSPAAVAAADRWPTRPHQRAQRPPGRADLDPAGTEVPVVPGRPAYHAAAEAQLAVVAGQLPAFRRGDAGREREVCDLPER